MIVLSIHTSYPVKETVTFSLLIIMKNILQWVEYPVMEELELYRRRPKDVVSRNIVSVCYKTLHHSIYPTKLFIKLIYLF